MILDFSFCDWTEQENCEELANIIAASESLETVKINNQTGSEDIVVKVNSDKVKILRKASRE